MTRKPGTTITRKGYVRITAGPHRHMLEHRQVTADSVAVFCPASLKRILGADGLPRGFHVHHADWKKRNNCPCNLQLLQREIHDFLRNELRRSRNIAMIQLHLAAGEAMTI